MERRKAMEGLSILQLALLEKGIINLQGEVDEDMFIYVRACLVALVVKDNPPIRIEIMSPGGSVTFGLIIYDLLRLYPGKKTGVVIGLARSIALIILQACDKRTSTRNSFVLFHHVARSNIDLGNLEDNKQLKKIMEEMRADQKKIYLILEKKTKKSRGVIVALCKEDRELSAQEALKFGLIDQIV